MSVWENFPKRCGCGRVFSAWEWVKLPNLRVWPPDFGEEPGRTFEQRDCPCGSSLVIDIPNPKGEAHVVRRSPEA